MKNENRFCRRVTLSGALLVLAACAMANALMARAAWRDGRERSRQALFTCNRLLHETVSTMGVDIYTLFNSLLADSELNRAVRELESAGDTDTQARAWSLLHAKAEETLLYRDWITGIAIVTESHTVRSGPGTGGAPLSWNALEHSGVLSRLRREVNALTRLTGLSGTDRPGILCRAGLGNDHGSEWVLMLFYSPDGFAQERRQFIAEVEGGLVWDSAEGAPPAGWKQAAKAAGPEGSLLWQPQQGGPRYALSVYGEMLFATEEGPAPGAAFPALPVTMAGLTALLAAAAAAVFHHASRALLRPVRRLTERIRSIYEVVEDPGGPERQGAVLGSYWINRLGFRAKLTATYLAAAALALAINCAAVFIQVRMGIEEGVSRAVRVQMEQAVRSAGFTLRRASGNSAYMAVNRDVQNMIVRRSRNNEVIVRQRLIFDSVVDSGVKYFGIFAADATALHSVGATALNVQDILSRNAIRMRNAVNVNQWQLTDEGCENLVFLRRVRNRDTAQAMGYIVVAISGESILSCLDWLAEYGEYTAAYDGEALRLDVRGAGFGARGQGAAAALRQRFLLGESNIPLILQIDRRALLGGFFRQLAGSGQLILLALLLCGCAAILCGFRLARPFQSFKDALEETWLGNMEVQLDKRGESEFDKLFDYYSYLAQAFERLYMNLYRKKLDAFERNRKENELRLICLQQQINPHFLYNTLASATFLIKMGEYGEAQELITQLGDLFRTSMYRGRLIVEAAEELADIRAYLAIQQIRYKDKLTVGWEIAEGILQRRMLKFTLQPIVENAILHSLEAVDYPVRIDISAGERDGVLVFTIADNGPGIEPAALEELNRGMREGAASRGIGLRNTNDRIRLYFGDGFGIALESDYGAGTVARIRLPADADASKLGGDLPV